MAAKLQNELTKLYMGKNPDDVTKLLTNDGYKVLSVLEYGMIEEYTFTPITAVPAVCVYPKPILQTTVKLKLEKDGTVFQVQVIDMKDNMEEFKKKYPYAS